MNGVTFEDWKFLESWHSFRDWGLILKSRPVISSPDPKYVFVDIPVSDSRVDLTESLTGDVHYYNRKITFEFNVLDARNKWTTVYSQIMNHLHGKQIRILLDEDPAYYYEGRVNINEWKSDKKTSVLTIEADVDPYKYRIQKTGSPWLWDPFNFETDTVTDIYQDIAVDGTYQMTIVGERKTVVPSFIVTSTDSEGLEVTMSYGTITQTATFADGEHRNPLICIRDGYNQMTVTGHGTFTIDFRGASL